MQDKIENFIDLLDIESIYSTDDTHYISFKYKYVIYMSGSNCHRPRVYMNTDIDQVNDAMSDIFGKCCYAIDYNEHASTIHVTMEIPDESVILALKMMRT